MKLKPIHYFLGGVALTALVAAARFAGGTPLDQTFTYQGQLRNAGQLVSGPVDLRITMWDSDTAGSQVGTANSFNAMQLTDGRFACGLNFGNAAFDGTNRWIQVEFRNPAGSGQYLALNPRDKITATPYALYALNGANGVWVYDTNQQSVSVMGKKVGIGTSNPTAALEVVSATGGDDSVKLPAGSIGASEMLYSPTFVTDDLVFGAGADFHVQVPRSGTLLIQICGNPGNPGPNGPVFVDEQPVGDIGFAVMGANYQGFAIHLNQVAIDVTPGSHRIRIPWYWFPLMVRCELVAGKLQVTVP